MKVSDILLKKFVRVVSEMYKKALKVQILDEVARRQVVSVKMLYNKESRVIDNQRLIYMLTTPI